MCFNSSEGVNKLVKPIQFGDEMADLVFDDPA